jgi:uncharacterized protein YneF (UPF0154 family)
MQNPPITEQELREVIAFAGSPTKAAPLLALRLGRRVSRRTVYRWMERYGITRQVSFDKAA